MLTAKFGVVFFGQASGVIWLPEVCPIELAKLRRMAGTGIERSASQNSTAMCSKPSSCYAPANLPLRYQSVARPHGRTIGVEPFGFRPIPRLQKRRQGTSCIGSLAGNGARPRVCAGESREKSSPGPGCFEKRSGGNRPAAGARRRTGPHSAGETRPSGWRGLSMYTWLTAALAVPTFALKEVGFYLFLMAVFVWTAKVALSLK